uniref:hypothetical protein n=1 Tax=Mediterraneibacter gnavus TaxID=33038 RepID=UPI001A9AF64F
GFAKPIEQIFIKLSRYIYVSKRYYTRENKIEILLEEGSTREKYVLCGCILLAAVLGIGLLFRKKRNQYD